MDFSNMIPASSHQEACDQTANTIKVSRTPYERCFGEIALLALRTRLYVPVARQCISAALSSSLNQGPQNINSGPNVGAIAGGVIGGVVVIALATYLIWRLFIKNRRQLQSVDQFEEEEDIYSEKIGTANGYAPSPDARASTHTVASLASTAFTRGSNVIQIAFIPGITDRTGPDGSEPPVPPIPILTTTSHPYPGLMDRESLSTFSAPAHHEEQDHYFMPTDLRNSAWSDTTDSDGRSLRSHPSSTTRQSITPSLARQSVASTIYRDDAIIHPLPAQAAFRGRPTMVSLTTSATTTPNITIPDVPTVDYIRYRDGDGGMRSTADGPVTTLNESSARRHSTLTAGEATSSDDASESNIPRLQLTAAIEEATRRASRPPTHGGLGSLRRDPGPFSDDNRLSTES